MKNKCQNKSESEKKTNYSDWNRFFVLFFLNRQTKRISKFNAVKKNPYVDVHLICLFLFSVESKCPYKFT